MDSVIVKIDRQIDRSHAENKRDLELELKKVKLTLDPLNFQFNAKTIGAKIIYNKKIIEFESIKSKISINSLIKNKIVSSNLIISTKSVLLKDLVGFLRIVTNKTELFLVEASFQRDWLPAEPVYWIRVVLFFLEYCIF